MAKVFEIAICKNSKVKMITISKVNVIAGKGLVEDRHFRENNDKGYLNINIKLIKERYDTTRANIVVPID